MAVTPVGSATVNGSTNIGKPAGTQSGDLILLFAQTEDSTSASSCTGFTSIGDRFNGSVQNLRVTALYKVAGASEPASYTVTPGASAGWTELTIFVLRGADTTTPIDVSASNSNTTANTSAVGASITTTAADYLVWFCALWSGGINCTPPSGYTSQVSDAGADLFVATNQQSAAGATGTATGTMGSADAWVTWHIGVKPAGAGGGTTQSGQMTAAAGANATLSAAYVTPNTIGASAHGDGVLTGTGIYKASAAPTAHGDGALTGTGIRPAQMSSSAHGDGVLTATGIYPASAAASGSASALLSAVYIALGALGLSGHGDGVLSATVVSTAGVAANATGSATAALNARSIQAAVMAAAGSAALGDQGVVTIHQLSLSGAAGASAVLAASVIRSAAAGASGSATSALTFDQAVQAAMAAAGGASSGLSATRIQTAIAQAAAAGAASGIPGLVVIRSGQISASAGGIALLSPTRLGATPAPTAVVVILDAPLSTATLLFVGPTSTGDLQNAGPTATGSQQ